MRQIKFRFWNTKTKTMYKDMPLISLSSHVKEKDETLNKCLTSFQTESVGFILMQFTGLHDKNGKEIYEGDIIRNENDEYKDYSVKWSEKVGGWVLGGNNCSDSYNDILSKFSPKEFWEVIGNVYENPELIK